MLEDFTAKNGDKPYKDLVWSYPAPFAGAEPIAGMLCFWSERVDLRVT